MSCNLEKLIGKGDLAQFCKHLEKVGCQKISKFSRLDIQWRRVFSFESKLKSVEFVANCYDVF